MTTTINIPVSGPTKREIIDYAYAETGRDEDDVTPEEVARALRRLNGMMTEWQQFRGIALGYDFPLTGDGATTDPSGIPTGALETVALYLGLRIAPTFGKTLSAETKAAMSRSLSLLQANYATIPSAIMPAGTPIGAGRRWRYPFSIRETV